ncbi:unnamed protein product [Caenorhabditis angaria]|uniref:Uncharacterized protein n=1 Tax=Caenorhabditis angaria TaxID=860376 RepID=A0A9P1NAG8_9PELO|nr:unnamed protein product [Caenorhabditis angaria]
MDAFKCARRFGFHSNINNVKSATQLEVKGSGYNSHSHKLCSRGLRPTSKCSIPFNFHQEVLIECRAEIPEESEKLSMGNDIV